jgi:hypothetical protein
LCTTILHFLCFFSFQSYYTMQASLLPFVDFGTITLHSHLFTTITYLESHITYNGVCFSMWLNWLLFMTIFLFIKLWYLYQMGCHQAPKVHCTNSHDMLHMLVMSSINLEKTHVCCSQRNLCMKFMRSSKINTSNN